MQLNAINALGTGGLTVNGGVVDLNNDSLSIGNSNSLPSLVRRGRGNHRQFHDRQTLLTVNSSWGTRPSAVRSKPGPTAAPLNSSSTPAGSLTLTGANTTAGGAEVHNAGTLAIASGGSLTTQYLKSDGSSTQTIDGLVSLPTGTWQVNELVQPQRQRHGRYHLQFGPELQQFGWPASSPAAIVASGGTRA